MNVETARKELEELQAQSIKIDDFATFTKHQRKIETAGIKLRYAEAREKADLLKEQEEMAAAEKAEDVRQQRIVLKMQQRLQEHLTDDYEKVLDELISTYKTGEELFKDVCDIDFNLEPDFIGLYRQEHHVHQLCRCLHARGFRPIIDAVKNFHAGPLPDEVNMGDFARRNDGGAEQ